MRRFPFLCTRVLPGWSLEFVYITVYYYYTRTRITDFFLNTCIVPMIVLIAQTFQQFFHFIHKPSLFVCGHDVRYNVERGFELPSLGIRENLGLRVVRKFIPHELVFADGNTLDGRKCTGDGKKRSGKLATEREPFTGQISGHRSDRFRDKTMRGATDSPSEKRQMLKKRKCSNGVPLSFDTFTRINQRFAHFCSNF